MPVFYNPMPKEVTAEAIHDFNLVGLVDGTPGDGSAAMACLEAGKPYAGICFTPHHVEALYERLDHLVWKAFQNESAGKLYQPQLAELLKKGNAVESKPPAVEPGKPPKRPRPKSPPPEQQKLSEESSSSDSKD